MILLPLVAFFIAGFSRLDPILKVGLMVIAACPGGATSNLVTYILKGNVALSISMTAINSLITLITIPLIVSLSIDAFLHQDTSIQMNVWNTIVKVFLITILPAFTGTRIRKWRPRFARSLEQPLRIILPILLLFIYAGVIFIDEGSGRASFSDFYRLFPPTVLLNLLAMGMGFLIARTFRLMVKNQYTISIEVGLQNSALAIFVAANLLQSPDMALVPVVYGSFTFFTTLLFGWFVKKLAWHPKYFGRLPGMRRRGK